MKIKRCIWFISFILIGTIILTELFYYSNTENFQNEMFDINYYVISLRTKEERMQNINEQNYKLNNQLKKYNLNKNIEIVDAVVGIKCNYDELVNNNTVNKVNVLSKDTSTRLKEIGCFLSHKKLYQKIKDTNTINNYTVVFEDDFVITDSFIDILYKSLEYLKNNNIDYDLLYLGNISDNKGHHIHDEIYKLDKNNTLWGTHGYLLKNSSIEKLLKITEVINEAIDNQLYTAGKKNEVLIYTIMPQIVLQNKSFESEITR